MYGHTMTAVGHRLYVVGGCSGIEVFRYPLFIFTLEHRCFSNILHMHVFPLQMYTIRSSWISQYRLCLLGRMLCCVTFWYILNCIFFSSVYCYDGNTGLWSCPLRRGINMAHHRTVHYLQQTDLGVRLQKYHVNLFVSVLKLTNDIYLHRSAPVRWESSFPLCPVLLKSTLWIWVAWSGVS